MDTIPFISLSIIALASIGVFIISLYREYRRPYEMEAMKPMTEEELEYLEMMDEVNYCVKEVYGERSEPCLIQCDKCKKIESYLADPTPTME